jgi:hypothetical protein
VSAAALILAAAFVAGSGLDCAKTPDALRAEIVATQGVKPYAGSDPLLEQWYDSAANLYAATKAGHPAHPVVVKRVLNQGARTTVDTSACGFGDKAAFDALMIQIDGLNRALIARYGG